MPKTSAQLETVESEDDGIMMLSMHLVPQTKLGRVVLLTKCAQGKKGSRRQKHFEASDDDFTTQAQVLCCVLIPGMQLTALGRGMPVPLLWSPQ